MKVGQTGGGDSSFVLSGNSLNDRFTDSMHVWDRGWFSVPHSLDCVIRRTALFFIIIIKTQASSKSAVLQNIPRTFALGVPRYSFIYARSGGTGIRPCPKRFSINITLPYL